MLFFIALLVVVELCIGGGFVAMIYEFRVERGDVAFLAGGGIFIFLFILVARWIYKLWKIYDRNRVKNTISYGFSLVSLILAEIFFLFLLFDCIEESRVGNGVGQLIGGFVVFLIILKIGRTIFNKIQINRKQKAEQEKNLQWHNQFNLLEEFLPKDLPNRLMRISEAQKFTIPADFIKKYPDILILILQTPSQTDKEKQEWFDTYPSMTSEQIEQLKEILTREQETLKQLENENERIIKAAFFLKSNMKKEALAEYDTILSSDPKNFSALIGKGDVLVSLKQYKKTISFYRKALKFAPTTVTAEAISSIYYTIITIELIFLSQYKKAIKDCNKRINIEKNKFLTYQVQGEIFVQLKQYDKAIKSFLTAISLIPDTATRDEKVGLYCDISDVYNLFGDKKSRRKYLNVALKLDPKFKNRLQKLDEEIASGSLFRQWGSSFLKGHYLLRLGKTQEAKDVFLAVIPLRDNDTPKIYIIDTYNTLAEIYKELGDKKAAKKYEQLAKKYRGGNGSK